MTAELDRLRTWMDANDHDSLFLSEKLGYESNMAGSVLNKRVPCGRNFRCMFARAFGDEVAQAIFDEPIPASAQYGSDHNPERQAANREIQLLASKEIVPKASLFRCYSCSKPAKHNHHPSYDPDRRLWVVPLCRSCHTKVHLGSLKLQLPLEPSLVRISIAKP